MVASLGSIRLSSESVLMGWEILEMSVYCCKMRWEISLAAFSMCGAARARSLLGQCLQNYVQTVNMAISQRPCHDPWPAPHGHRSRSSSEGNTGVQRGAHLSILQFGCILAPFFLPGMSLLPSPAHYPWLAQLTLLQDPRDGFPCSPRQSKLCSVSAAIGRQSSQLAHYHTRLQLL